MEEQNQHEYIETLLRIINKDLPIIYKYNTHLYQNILSAIELVMDQSYKQIENSELPEITPETKEEVDKIISELKI